MTASETTARALTPADPLRELMRGRYVDPRSGVPVRVATQALAIEDSLSGAEAELVSGLGLGRQLAVVSDAATHEVMGARVERALAGAYRITSIVLDANPHADDATVDRIGVATADASGLVAVGSGTINDLTKYASALARKPYVVFGTAPSMNGYTSLTASITQHGHKHTLPAQAPVGAFFDLGVMAKAPARMIRAGLGDSICRTTAQADWLLSHLLLGTPYHDLPFDLLRDDEPVLLDAAEDLVGGDLAAMRVLVRTLTLSGFGTSIVGSSAPASQAEHLVSHFIDMLAPADRPAVFHGEQVGVTTLSIARLYEEMLGRRPTLAADVLTADGVRATFGPELDGSVWAEFDAKRLSADKAAALNHRLATEWDGIAERVGVVLLPAKRVEAVLRAAGAALTPESIFLSRGFYEHALRHGREIRNRYTILDLAAQSGRLEPLLSSL